MEKGGELQGEFDMEIHQITGGTCIRYHGRVDITPGEEFNGIFWICGGLGAFESFSGMLQYDGKGYKARINSEERPTQDALVHAKQVISADGARIFELEHTNSCRTSIIVRRID